VAVLEPVPLHFVEMPPAPFVPNGVPLFAQCAPFEVFFDLDPWSKLTTLLLFQRFSGVLNHPLPFLVALRLDVGLYVSFVYGSVAHWTLPTSIKVPGHAVCLGNLLLRREELRIVTISCSHRLRYRRHLMHGHRRCQLHWHRARRACWRARWWCVAWRRITRRRRPAGWGRRLPS